MRRKIPALCAAAALAAALLAGCASTAPTGELAAPTHAVPAPRVTTAPPTPTSISPVAPPSTSAAPVVSPVPPNHCAHNSYDQLVLVRVSAQHMWLCHGHTTVESNPVTTGMLGQYTETPTGHYVIQGLDRNTVLTLNTGAQYDVKYWIPFDAPLFGFHDSSWQQFPYGSPQYKSAGSHGCIHMPLAAIAFLYHWAQVGAHVSIS